MGEMMYRAARALIIKPPRDNQQISLDHDPLQEIMNFGISAETVYAGGKVDLSAIASLPDIVILDAANSSDPMIMADYSRQLLTHSLSSILPIVMIGKASDFAKFDVNLHLDCRAPAHVIAKKLKHAIRIAAMKLEHMARLETARVFGIAAEAAAEPAPAKSERLLVVGKGERYFQLASAFQGTASLKCVTTFAEAWRILEEKAAFDCLIIDTFASPDFDLDDLKARKLNTRFFSLPVLLLQEGLSFETQEALAETGICDLFDLQGGGSEIAAYVKTLIQAERMRLSLLTAFKAPRFEPVHDRTTGLASRAFFEKHLERLLVQSRAWRIPVAFGLLDVSVLFHAGGESDHARCRVIHAQVGQTIASLVRAEDTATHLGDGKFVIAAPNSTGLTISVLIGRISAVLGMTAFSVGDELGRIDIDTHYFESRPGDSLQTVMQELTGG